MGNSGKLDISSNPTTLNCRNCGNEHLVRRESGSVSLEAFAKCPKCNRNDKVRKVSAIVRSEIHQLSGTTTQTNDYRDQDGRWYSSTSTVPFNGTQASVLAQLLSPPQKPEPKSFSRFLTIFGGLMILGDTLIIGLGFVAGFMGFFMGLTNGSSAQGPAISLLIGIVTGGVLFIPTLVIGVTGLLMAWAVFASKKNHDKRERIRVARELPAWQKAMSKWEKLYYCERDDTVFDMQSHSYVSPGQTIDFCFEP